MSQEQELELPSQCIGTAEALISAYGYDRGVEVMEGYKKTIEQTYKALKDSNEHPPEFLLQIAVQADFWSQCIQAAEQNEQPLLSKDFMHGLDTTPE